MVNFNKSDYFCTSEHDFSQEISPKNIVPAIFEDLTLDECNLPTRFCIGVYTSKLLFSGVRP